MTGLDFIHPAAFWSALADTLDRGEPAYVALVGDHTRGSPGTKGAKWFATATGDPVGTIGGGIMELRLHQRAPEILAAGNARPELHRLFHRKNAPGEESGLICAGEQTNITLVCTPSEHAKLIRKVATLAADGIRGQVTVTPEGLTVDADPPTLEHPSVQTLDADSNRWTYREQLLNRKRVAIIGGGHCGRALSRTLRHLGYHVSVFDRRAGVEPFRENPFADRREVVDDYREAGPLIQVPEVTRVVVMTSDFPSDVNALLGTAGLPFPFIGVMGSKTKIRQIKQDLKDAGLSEDAIAALHAPIGLPIASHTPDEIAISIAAQFIAESRPS